MKKLLTFTSALTILATITISVVAGVAQVQAQTEGEEATIDEETTEEANESPKDKKLDLRTHFVDDNIVIEVGQTRGLEVSCPSGEQVTGGGYHADPDMTVYINSPSEGQSGIAVGWQVAASNNGNQAHELVAFVMCAQPEK
jgi:hypothetical protein